MRYQILGPFALPTTADRELDFSLEARKMFWCNAEAETGYEELRMGRGCYLYAIRAGKGIRPWYVGQSKGPFLNEVFAPSKLEHYQAAHESYQRGTSILFLIARLTPGRKLMKGKLSEDEAKFVERRLIISAYRENRRLRNVHQVKYAKELVIPGLFNDKTSEKKMSESTKDFRIALGLN